MTMKTAEMIQIMPHLSIMVNKNQINILCELLENVITTGIEGNIVELGCNCGTTSVYLQALLEDTGRKLYLYDSFEGLPEKRNEDESPKGQDFVKGHCKTAQEYLEKHLKNLCKTHPIVLKSWFKDIPDDKLPKKIAFAFFDGDFYDSIIDSFEKVYDRMSVGGFICIHDYEYPPLPGVKKACDDFLKGKPEEGTIVMVDCIGIMRKL